MPAAMLLHRRVPEISLDEAPLSEVLELLASLSHPKYPVNILPRWRVLAAEGIDGDTPITARLRNATVAEVLSEVLEQISGLDPITYVGSGNKLRITTRSNLRRKLITRSYVIADILAYARFTRVQPRMIIGPQVSFGGATVTQGGTGALTQTIDLGTNFYGGRNDNERDDDAGDDEDFVQRIIDAIQMTIEPDTWSINGGRGTLTVIDGVLTVRNSADVHAQLGGPFLVK
jgi:hypothetical protein